MTNLQPSVGPSVTSGFHRTIVFVEYHSQFGQQLFLRGGINYERRPRTTKLSILYTRKFHCYYTAYSVLSLDLSLHKTLSDFQDAPFKLCLHTTALTVIYWHLRFTSSDIWRRLNKCIVYIVAVALLSSV